MQSRRDKIDKMDDFSKKVGDTLRDYKIPVNPDIWDSINNAIPAKKRSVMPYRFWAIAGVAAILLVFMLLLFPIAEDKGNLAQIPEDNDYPTAVSAISEESPKSDERAIRDIAQEMVRTEYLGKKVAGEVTTLVDELELSPEVDSQEEMKVSDVIPYIDNIDIETFIAYSETPVQIKKEAGSSSLLVSLGSGGSLSGMLFGSLYDEAPMDYGNQPSDGSDVSNGHEGGGFYDGDLSSLAEFTDIEHYLPISFSLMAGFPLSESLSIDAGISYTYLYSRFRQENQAIYRASLKQHYIGLPINIRYRAWNKDDMQIYLWAGGNIEKGVWSVYRQEIEYNNEMIHNAVTGKSIDGFQFSIQGGVGLGYRLRDNIYLYGEPRIIHYFQNNQPMSSRTENPLVFGFNLGLRINLTSNN